MSTFSKTRGFTLIEVLVSVALFSVVMVIALGALLAISVSDRKAESLKSVINNLNFAVDGMSRAVRTGSNWGCDASHTLNPTAGTDCSTTGANEIIFTSAPTVSNPSGVVTYYRLESATDDPGGASAAAALCNQTSPNIGCIVKSTDSTNGTNGTWLPITSPEVVIQDCSTAGGCSGSGQPSYLFYMLGSVPGGVTSPEPAQPKLVVTLSGYVKVTGGAGSQSACGTVGNQCSVFHLQTAVTQRIYDQ